MKTLCDFEDPFIKRSGCKPVWINRATFESLNKFASDNEKDVKDIIEYLVVLALKNHERKIEEKISFDLESV